MLPQFGYIVAQAGADSYPNNPPQQGPSPPPPYYYYPQQLPQHYRLPPPPPILSNTAPKQDDQQQQQQQGYRPLQPLLLPSRLNDSAPSQMIWHPEQQHSPLPPIYQQPPIEENSDININNNNINNKAATFEQPVVEKDQITTTTTATDDQSPRWHDIKASHPKVVFVRRIRESNELITLMDTEFWEQCDE
ncbi:MAG: hypothetical protein EXX96DRAFT_117415 [Benjaminiella poitrasii]|nr:MAG: hypothetical protein EXX96DRAFT_117415 [Benjaminiella poitrasii]